MNTKSRKIICGLLTAALAVSAFTGCGAKTNTDTETKKTTSAAVYADNGPDICEPAEYHVVDVSNKDIFETGYYSTQAEFEYGEYSSHTVYFGRWADFEINWYVYVLDEEVKDLEELKEMEPSVVNKGEMEIAPGQWIYVYCDCNSATADEPSIGTFGGSYFGA